MRRAILMVVCVAALQGCAKHAAIPVAATPPKPTPAIPHIKAGGYICTQSYFVMGERQLRDRSASVAFQGCEQVGANIPVNVLGRDERAGAVKVGNVGGVAWIDEQDLAQ